MSEIEPHKYIPDMTYGMGDCATCGNTADSSLHRVPAASLQWKGTLVCLDFVCACGHRGHLDSYFAHVIMCAWCGRKYGLDRNIELIDIQALSKNAKNFPDWTPEKEALYHEDSPRLPRVECPRCNDVNSRWEEVIIKSTSVGPSIPFSGHRLVLKCMNGHIIMGWPDKLPEWLTEEVIRNASI